MARQVALAIAGGMLAGGGVVDLLHFPTGGTLTPENLAIVLILLGWTFTKISLGTWLIAFPSLSEK